MKVHEAREFSAQIGNLVLADKIHVSICSLAPVLAERTPFRILDQIGKGIRSLNRIAPTALDEFYEETSNPMAPVQGKIP